MDLVVSQVQFFGGWSNDDLPVVVKDVTFRAFRALVDYIYGKPLDRGFFDVLGLEAAARLLELAYAAEKYQVRAPLINSWILGSLFKGEQPDWGVGGGDRQVLFDKQQEGGDSFKYL